MRKIIIIQIIFLLFMTLTLNNVYAKSDMTAVVTAMNGASAKMEADTNIGGVINTIIGIIQYVGSGISVITVTIFGIKYLISSPQDKADVKKQITPILIGCVLLFGAVNLASAISTFTGTILPGDAKKE